MPSIRWQNRMVILYLGWIANKFIIIVHKIAISALNELMISRTLQGV